MRAHGIASLFSTFGPSFRFAGSTMPSADFCALTHHVSMKSAIRMIMSCCLFRVSHLRDSYPSTATEYAGSLVNRVDLSGIALMNLLSHDAQISPDKNVNFPCTNAAFTLSPEPMGFVVLCQLAQGLSLVCDFCSSSRTFALRLPSDGRSPSRPCLRLVLLLVSITMNTFRFSYRGLSPHKFTPVPGVHKSFETDAQITRRSTLLFGQRDKIWRNTVSGIVREQPSAM